TSLQSRLGGRLHRNRRSAVALVVIAVAVALTLAACGGSSKGVKAFSADDLTALPQQDWITNGGTVFNQRYSPLDEIDRSNVGELKGVWRIHLNSATAFKYSGETQPLVNDGIADLSTGESDVFALDVETGKTIWQYSGNLDQEINTVCCRVRRRCGCGGEL